MEFKVPRVIAGGPIVFVERPNRHLGAHGWRDLPVTGVFEVQGARITIWRKCFDLMTMQNGITAAPIPETAYGGLNISF